MTTIEIVMPPPASRPEEGNEEAREGRGDDKSESGSDKRDRREERDRRHERRARQEERQGKKTNIHCHCFFFRRSKQFRTADTADRDRGRGASVASSVAPLDTQCPICGQWCVGDFGLTQHQDSSKRCLAHKYYRAGYSWADASQKAAKEWKKKNKTQKMPDRARRTPSPEERKGKEKQRHRDRDRDRSRSKSRRRGRGQDRGRSGSRLKLREKEARGRFSEKRAPSPVAKTPRGSGKTDSKKPRTKPEGSKGREAKPPQKVQSSGSYYYTSDDDESSEEAAPNKSETSKALAAGAAPKAAPKTAVAQPGKPPKRPEPAACAQESQAVGRMEAMASFFESQAKLLRN